MENRSEELSKILGLYRDMLIDKVDVCQNHIYKNALFMEIIDGRLNSLDCVQNLKNLQNDTISDFNVLSFNLASATMAYAFVSYIHEGIHTNNILGFVRDMGQWKIVLSLQAEHEDLLENWCSSEKQQKNDICDIVDAIGVYVQGIYTLDSKLALSVFDPQARMLSADGDGRLADYPCTVFKERWEGISSAAESGIEKFCNIENIRFLSGDMAIVQVMDAKRWDFFNDFLSFGRINGKWTIIHKITRMPTHKNI